jgi:hypothetical protein
VFFVCGLVVFCSLSREKRDGRIVSRYKLKGCY